jgi:hypothetical protein
LANFSLWRWRYKAAVDAISVCAGELNFSVLVYAFI